jgi:hypothetical protein
MMSLFGRKRKKLKEKSIEDMLKEEDLFEQEKKNNIEETRLTENDILLENPILQSEFTFDLEEDTKLLDELIKEEFTENNIDQETSIEEELSETSTIESDLEKFDFIKEGGHIDSTEENTNVSTNTTDKDDNESNFEIEQILDFSDDNNESDELISEYNIDDKDGQLNKEKIEEIFNYLKEKCGMGFLSGLLVDKLNARELYNYNSNNDIFSIFVKFYQKLEEQVSKSEFEKQKNFYLVDLKDNQILFVLTYKIHHFVLTFDKTKISVGFIIYIIKSNIDAMYESALIKLT